MGGRTREFPNSHVARPSLCCRTSGEEAGGARLCSSLARHLAQPRRRLQCPPAPHPTARTLHSSPATSTSDLQVPNCFPKRRERPENASSGSCHAEREAGNPNPRFSFARQPSSNSRGLVRRDSGPGSVSRGGQNHRLLTGLERCILGGGGRVGRRSLCGCIKAKLKHQYTRRRFNAFAHTA